MSNAFAEIVTFRMTVADASDGAIRVLTDAQRFGLDLVSLDLQPAQTRRHAGEGEADLTIVLSAGRPIDTDLLATRFVRHPCVRVFTSIVPTPPASMMPSPSRRDRGSICLGLADPNGGLSCLL